MLVKREHATRAGLESARYAGHSLRQGSWTAAAREHKSIFKMAEHSRHKSREMLRQYVEDERKFDVNSHKALLSPTDSTASTDTV